MAKHVNPLLAWLREHQGTEHPDYELFAAELFKRTGRLAVADSLRLIAGGHRPPSGYLALDIETATKRGATARALLEWPYYVRPAKRAA